MNIYYDPEYFGLTPVAEIDTAGSYAFTKVVVWRDTAGQHYIARDSGCSCPSPFEGINGVYDLTRFDIHSISEVEYALNWANASKSEEFQFMEDVKASLERKIPE